MKQLVPRNLAEGKISGLKEVKVFIFIIINSLRCLTTQLFCLFIQPYYRYHQHPALPCFLVIGVAKLALLLFVT